MSLTRVELGAVQVCGALGQGVHLRQRPTRLPSRSFDLGVRWAIWGVDNIEESGRPARYGHTLQTCDSFRNASDYKGLEIMCRINGLLQ